MDGENEIAAAREPAQGQLPLIEPARPVPADPLPRVSVSGLLTFEHCSLEYYGRYVRKTGPPPSPAMRRGLSVHRLIEQHLKGKEPDIGAADEAERALFATFLASRFNRPALAIERRIVASLPSIRVSGRIDLVQPADSGVEIIDFKTGRPAEREDLAERIQLPLYALALHRLDHLPHDRIAFTWVYLAHGSEQRFQFSPDWERRVEDRVEALAAEIGGETWWEHPCGTCWACQRWLNRSGSRPLLRPT